MRSICCQYTGTAFTGSAGFENNSFIVNETHAEVSTSQVSLASNTQISPQTIDSNLFDSFFSGLGSWDLTQQANLALRSPHREFTLDAFSLNDSSDSSPPELIPLSSGPLPRLGAEEVTNSAALANHSMELIFRVLRSWPRMLAEDFQLPPIFHSTHITPNKTLPAPLANCITLAKMWHGQCEGAEEMVRKTILRELDSIVDHSEQLDETTLLAVLQSVVIYTIILLSPARSQQRLMTDHHIIFRKVELLVYQIVHAGLFLQEERTQKQPSWEAWLHVTSKRRAVLALYLLHWAYSVLHKVPCFDCTDLGFMPAPAAKVLWQAQTEQEWNTRYIHWLSRWNGQGYLQGELGKIRPGIVMNPRAERWLEETDEFGFIMISIGTSFTPCL
jgi:hypothetical protein